MSIKLKTEEEWGKKLQLQEKKIFFKIYLSELTINICSFLLKKENVSGCVLGWLSSIPAVVFRHGFIGLGVLIGRPYK